MDATTDKNPDVASVAGADGGPRPTDRAALRFRPDIEGLRAVAILLVVLDHLGVPGFRAGFMGVDVFFVISGFLITSLLAAEREGRLAQTGTGSGLPISLLAFYGRRARRILPAALTVIAAVLLVAKIRSNPVRFDLVSTDALWATLFGANLHLMASATDMMGHAIGYFAVKTSPPPLENFWSLAVEEQFYLVWPMLIILSTLAWGSGRLASRVDWSRFLLAVVALLGLASFAWAAIATSNDAASAFFSPFTRAWELALGAALALFFHGRDGPGPRGSRATSLLGSGLLVLGMAFLGPGSSFPGPAALLPTVGAALIIAGGIGPDSAGPVSRALSARLPRFVGRISYSLYLWHWPMIVFAAEFVSVRDLGGGRRTLVLFALCMVVAWLSWRFIERPFRQLGTPRSPLRRATGTGGRTSIRPGVAVAMGLPALLVVGVIASLARPAIGITSADRTASSGQVANWAESISAANASPTVGERAIRLAARGTAMGPEDCWEVAVPSQIDRCTLPGLGKGGIDWPAGLDRDVILIGNSFAAQWREQVADLLPRDTRLIPITATQCDPTATVGAEVNYFGHSCKATRELVLSEIRRLRPGLVVFSTFAATNSVDVERLFALLAGSARHLMWIGFVPTAPPAVKCVERGRDVSRCSVSTATLPGLNGYDDDYMAVARSAGASYADLLPFYCDGVRCPAFVDQVPLRTDGRHLTDFAMSASRGVLIRSVREALRTELVAPRRTG